MKYYKGFILWKRAMHVDGTPFEPTDTNEFSRELDKWHCYLTLDFHKEWLWGYDCLLMDCQGHETFGFGKFSIQWSVMSSYNRADRIWRG